MTGEERLILGNIIKTHKRMVFKNRISPPLTASARKKYAEDRTHYLIFDYKNDRYKIYQRTICVSQSIEYDIIIYKNDELIKMSELRRIYHATIYG